MMYTLFSIMAIFAVIFVGEFYSASIADYFVLTETSYSNSTRFYSAYGQILAAMDSPIFGFGADFTKRELLSRLPIDAFNVAVSEYWYLHDLDSSATFFSLAIRVLTQSGLVGGLLFAGMWISALLKCYRLMLLPHRDTREVASYPFFLFLSIASSFMLTLFVGVLLVYPYWILLGLASALNPQDNWKPDTSNT